MSRESERKRRKKQTKERRLLDNYKAKIGMKKLVDASKRDARI